MSCDAAPLQYNLFYYTYYNYSPIHPWKISNFTLDYVCNVWPHVKIALQTHYAQFAHGNSSKHMYHNVNNMWQT